ncbi:MAG: DUF2914 domain-containing protein [Desulfobacterales bacterium]
MTVTAIPNRFWVRVLVCLSMATAVAVVPAPVLRAQQETVPRPETGLTLVRAVMCEGIHSFKPVNAGVAFSVSVGKIFCYTAFESIPTKMFIHHIWYRNDQLVTRRGLQLLPPRWSSASSIQIRDADKGLWRVEITDDEGRVLKTLRFSIID